MISVNKLKIEAVHLEKKISISIEEYDELIKFKNLFTNLMKRSSDFIYFKDINFNFTYASQPFIELTKQSSVEELSNKNDFDVFDEDHAKHYRSIDELVLEGEEICGLEESYFDVYGNLCWVSTSKTRLVDEHNNLIGMFGISRDITEVKRLEEKLQKTARYDSLTQLLNRRAFSIEGQRITNIAMREKKKVALYFVDLDGFKGINDNFGHEAGDHVLTIVSNRLINNFRSSDLIARWGGDEFVILAIVSIDSEIKQRCVKIINNIEEKIEFNDQFLKVSCSIGVNSNVNSRSQFNEMISNTDEAMYEAKRKGKGTFALVT